MTQTIVRARLIPSVRRRRPSAVTAPDIVAHRLPILDLVSIALPLPLRLPRRRAERAADPVQTRDVLSTNRTWRSLCARVRPSALSLLTRSFTSFIAAFRSCSIVASSRASSFPFRSRARWRRRHPTLARTRARLARDGFHARGTDASARSTSALTSRIVILRRPSPACAEVERRDAVRKSGARCEGLFGRS